MMQDQDTACLKEPEDPQPCSQNTITGLNAKLDSQIHTLFNLYFQIISLSTTRHCKWPPPAPRFSNANIVCISHLHRA
jgi:hypothetical protein